MGTSAGGPHDVDCIVFRDLATMFVTWHVTMPVTIHTIRRKIHLAVASAHDRRHVKEMHFEAKRKLRNARLVVCVVVGSTTTVVTAVVAYQPVLTGNVDEASCVRCCVDELC